MNFFKTFLASFLGILTGTILLFLIILAAVISSSTEPEPYVRSNTVLTFSMKGDIPARVMPDPFEELFNPNFGTRLSLATLKSNLEKAATDDNIEGVWVKTNYVAASWANLETAYRYFEKYKESGKFLYFSTDDIGMNEKSYFLASLADSVFSPPETNFEFDGFVVQLKFYRDMLDKIGIEPEIFRVGKYKSAVEPFLQTSSSPESRQQLQEILETASSTYIEAVAARTGRSYNQINTMLDTEPVDRLNYALNNGLIDAFAFEDDVEKIIKERMGLDEDDDLRTISFGRYTKVSDRSAGLDSPRTSDKIAVIYASGNIMPQLDMSPFGTAATITANGVKKQLDEVLNDDDVKAIVIHINSPGGAATTSDLLWNSIKKASGKKPVVASMGTVAASGGYYMAMGADTVVAAENTITGSIGIFNLLFNAQELMEEKIGIDYENLKTHQYADLFNLTRPFSENESRIIQQNVENGYEAFLNRVADARHMTRNEVHEVAQGRVYTGAAAKEAGLVDILGDIDTAIGIAAEMAGIEAYKLDTYPKKKDLYEVLFNTANVKMKSWMHSWIPSDVQQNMNDLSMLINSPAGQNWMFLPIYFDAN